MRKKDYQCPYEDISCDQLNSLTLTLDCGSCRECPHYGNGIRFSKGLYFNWDIIFWLVIISTILFLISSCGFDQPTSLRRFNNNQGKIVHDILPVYGYYNGHDTIGNYLRVKTDSPIQYDYVLRDPVNDNKFNQITIGTDYHFYEIGDTLP